MSVRTFRLPLGQLSRLTKPASRTAPIHFPAHTTPGTHTAAPASSRLYSATRPLNESKPTKPTESFSLPTTGMRNSNAENQEESRRESTVGLSEWKLRAPYRIHEPNEHFEVRYNASCHCEKVSFQLSRQEPLDSKLCHCTTCQKQHAAPFQWAAIFHKTDINFVHGHHNLEWYDPTDKTIEHKLPCKVRCAYCHSPIMDEGRNMILMFPSLINFKSEEDKLYFKPRCHMFYDQRVIDVPDGLPKWTGLNQASDLIEDSPPEMIKERERKIEKEREERFEKGEHK